MFASPGYLGYRCTTVALFDTEPARHRLLGRDLIGEGSAQANRQSVIWPNLRRVYKF
jgi:hypothetical protein